MDSHLKVKKEHPILGKAGLMHLRILIAKYFTSKPFKFDLLHTELLYRS